MFITQDYAFTQPAPWTTLGLIFLSCLSEPAWFVLPPTALPMMVLLKLKGRWRYMCSVFQLPAIIAYPRLSLSLCVFHSFFICLCLSASVTLTLSFSVSVCHTLSSCLFSFSARCSFFDCHLLSLLLSLFSPFLYLSHSPFVSCYFPWVWCQLFS